MTIDIINDSTMCGYCTTAIRHAQEAGHEVIGVCLTSPLEDDEPYNADEVDAELTARLGQPCGTYGEGEDDDEGNTATPIIALISANA